MSNPYGNDPYGQPPPPSNPYGPPAGGSGFNEQPKTDGVSIAAFVLSLLCCSPVALVLGIVGIVRTKGGQRKGRWAAIIGLILSIVGLIGGAVVIAIGGVFLASVVEPGEAEVGQCVNIDEEDDAVLMREAECNEEHDAEIVGVAEVTDDNLEQIEAEMIGYCVEAISDEDFAKLSEYVEDIKAVTQDPNDVEVGDDLVCYVEPGDKLDEPIL